MIALLREDEGICLDGRWRGWLFRRLNGEWVSVRKLDEVNPFEPSDSVLAKLKLFDVT